MRTLAFALIAAAILGGCASPAARDAAVDRKALAMMTQDFRDRGIAKAARLEQDEVQAACTSYGDQPPHEVLDRLEKQQLDAIKWPADGTYLGDWKKGETLAQSGRGMTWSDEPGSPNGGNCYNCHQLSAKELSYGTIGPSLLGFGKGRSQRADLQRYTWGKIYNAKAYSLCSNMPRFGHFGILSEQQIKDLVAYLLDPESPVNK
jgi:sulfur-oxidizing protein SoxX